MRTFSAELNPLQKEETRRYFTSVSHHLSIKAKPSSRGSENFTVRAHFILDVCIARTQHGSTSREECERAGKRET